MTHRPPRRRYVRHGGTWQHERRRRREQARHRRREPRSRVRGPCVAAVGERRRCAADPDRARRRRRRGGLDGRCTSALYPLGPARPARQRPAPAATASGTCRPSQRGLVDRDVEAAGTPILLVHGMVDNRSIFTVLRRGLRRRGFGRIDDDQLLPAHRRRPGRGRPARRRRSSASSRRPATSASTSSATDGRADRPLLRDPARRRRARAHPGHARARRTRAPTAPTRWNTADPAAAPGQRADARARRSRSRTARPGSSSTGPTSTRSSSPSATPRLHHPDLHVRNVDLHGVGHMSLPITGSVVHGISTALAHLDTDGCDRHRRASAPWTRRTSRDGRARHRGRCARALTPSPLTGAPADRATRLCTTHPTSGCPSVVHSRVPPARRRTSSTGAILDHETVTLALDGSHLRDR